MLILDDLNLNYSNSMITFFIRGIFQLSTYCMTAFSSFSSYKSFFPRIALLYLLFLISGASIKCSGRVF